jgi:uncharacterized membrane protein
MHVLKAITVMRPIAEVYDFWLDFQNMPRFMSHLAAVDVGEGGFSRWRTKGVDGDSAEWDTEVTEKVANEMIAWQAVKGSEVANSGAVFFTQAPGDRGTEVRIDFTWEQSGGKLGSLFARLLGEDPTIEIEKDLRRFKQILETGEVVNSDASIHTGMHPARPAEVDEPAAVSGKEGGP